ncbi:MAG: phosphoenolpyruvate carboxylase [Chthoniobacterales bacterium]|nr:phosphoenolpyruvate carboxylase [Chthoniobacterales bacterium]
MEPNYLIDGFQKIDRDLQFLISCFREVLNELGEKETAALLPWFYHHEEQPPLTLEKNFKGLEQAYSIAFQLLNIVEANAAERTRTLREIGSGLKAERGLWGNQLFRLQQAGYSPEEIAAFLPNVRVEPVFTAHPTEAKRGAVLEQHRILHQLLAAADQEGLTPSEQKNIRRKIKVSLEKLWRSGEIFLDQPNVSDERRGILFYLRDILPTAILRLDDRLRCAWEELGFSTSLITNPSQQPQLRFGIWAGGDRDGHPFVTTEVTQATFSELRLNALLIIHRQLQELSRALPLSSHFQQPSKELLEAIRRFQEELGPLAQAIFNRYSKEPWRQFVLLIQAKLPLSLQPNGTALLDESKAHFKDPQEVAQALHILIRSLESIQGDRLVRDALWPVLRILSVFGFHIAELDIRQNSKVHDVALMQILQAANIPEAATFLEWDEERRLAFLRKELSINKKLLESHHPLDKKLLINSEAQEILGCYALLREELTQHGSQGIGSLIVSMTRRVSDLLVVMLLAREGNLAAWDGKTWFSLLPIVPLFETYHDLHQSSELLSAYLQEPSALATLDYQHKIDYHSTSLKKKKRTQQIMIGYSDSNKDCGILASQWILYEAQHAMSKAAASLGIALRFFHGRGGTISRGAGPTHLFLDALPPQSLQGDLRMTEQGETIAQKYGTPTNAVYHLELLLAGVTGVSLLKNKKTSLKQLEPVFKTASFLAHASRQAYQELIHTKGFITFYEQATPIDALEATRIGSRPKRRSGERTLSDLRAIPWVFSWNQSRYFLPGWFGVGTALQALEKEHPDLFQELVVNYRTSPFLNYVLSNIETNLASAQLPIMKKYASLVLDPEIRETIFSQIAQEFHKTELQLKKVFGSSLKERRPRMEKTLALRAKALDLLHQQQIVILKAWREAQQNNPARAGVLLPRVLLSVNAIASGLRTTG